MVSELVKMRRFTAHIPLAAIRIHVTISRSGIGIQGSPATPKHLN